MMNTETSPNSIARTPVTMSIESDDEALMEPIDEDFWEERHAADDVLNSKAAQSQVIEWPTATEEDDMDARIARDMTGLTCEERDYVLDDIHGVSDPIVETPELLTASLQELESLTRNLPNRDAYNEARIRDARYVENRDFRLKFLRAERFDAKKAATRLVRHFQVKLDLFGKELLVKDITQEDLDQGDLQNLYSGHMQNLPLRDRAGRHINFWIPRLALTEGVSGHEMIHKVSALLYVYILYLCMHTYIWKGIYIFGNNDDANGPTLSHYYTILHWDI
jgi:hypothetical protein